MKSIAFRIDKRFIRRARELKTVTAMVHLYCRKHHRAIQGLCDECNVLLDYARRRLEVCPFGDAKPACNKCLVHCYSVERREQVRVIMRWAGPRMLRYHPLMAIRHLLAERRPPPRLPAKKEGKERVSDGNRSFSAGVNRRRKLPGASLLE